MKNKIFMILPNRFYPDIRVLKEAQYLVKQGYETEILCWDRQNEFLEKKTEFFGKIKVSRFYPHSVRGSGYKQIPAMLKFASELKNYLSNIEVEVLHCHDIEGLLIGIYIKMFKKCKLIFDMHEFYEGKRKRKWEKFVVRAILKILFNFTEKILYVNKKQLEYIHFKHECKFVYLPNYPETANFKDIIKEEATQFKISYIGSVRQYNEIKNLIDACKEIKNVLINIHGYGIDYAKIKDYSLNKDYVNVTGTYNYSESCGLYKDTDILFAVYNREDENWKYAYPIKFYEALITETPIIVNKGTVLADFVNVHNIGYVVDGDNILELENKIKQIISNRKELDQFRNNIKKINKEFVWESIVQNLANAYNDIFREEKC